MNCEKWRELAAKFANHCVKEGKLEDTLLMREACAVGWLCAAVEIIELERDSLTRRLAESQRLRQAADDFVANVRGHHIAGWGEIEVASDRSFQDLARALDRLKIEG